MMFISRKWIIAVLLIQLHIGICYFIWLLQNLMYLYEALDKIYIADFAN